jgi:hypothetical protein
LELIEKVRASRDGLLKVIEGLTPEAIAQPFTMGKWSVKDVFSHIAGWDVWMRSTIENMLGGKEPDLSAPFDVHSANVKFVKERTEFSFDQILTEMSDTLEIVFRLVEKLTEEDIFTPLIIAGHDHSVNHLLTVTYTHDRGHAYKILRWRKLDKTDPRL